ncbi:MAG: hypothetical protein JOZ14_04020 [Acidobacteria bacterium]|nr:hypothetical protein [Acidobacteriota bacterium]
MRNTTITLEEHVARWSRLLADVLKDYMRQESGYDKAMRRALSREPFLKIDGHYLSREEVHERSRRR